MLYFCTSVKFDTRCHQETMFPISFFISFLFMSDHRKSSLNPITSIVAINLNDGNIQGNIFQSKLYFAYHIIYISIGHKIFLLPRLLICFDFVIYFQVSQYHFCIIFFFFFPFGSFGLKNQRNLLAAMISMPFHELIQKKREWHGLNGVTLTCLGTKQNSGLGIFLKMGKCWFLL